MHVSTIAQIKSVINKLPHVPCRVPYTYHHDWVRNHVPAYFGYSRAEIAALKCDEYELYALALVEIIIEAGLYELATADLSNQDRNIIRECMAFADEMQ